MPIYEYRCSVCGKRHEVIRKFSDAPLKVCPDCGGELKKLISNTSFVLKGTGWYVTDYASQDRISASQKDKSPNVTEAKAETKNETKTESKVENSTETKTEPKNAPKTENKTEAKAA